MQKDSKNATLRAADVKQLISAKFGSLRRFCKIVDKATEYDNIRVFLNREIKDYERLVALYNLALSTPDEVAPDEISDQDRRWLNRAIETEYGRVSSFLKDYPGIARQTLVDILKGRTKRKNEVFDMVVRVLSSKLS